MRLFAAIRPPVVALEHLEAAVMPLRAGVGERLRWVPLDQLHLTVAFYGEVPDGAAFDLQVALAEAVAGSGPLRLALQGAGTFSGQNLWVGVSGETHRLRELMVTCADAPFGESNQDRAPRPHLTIARVGRRARHLDVQPIVRALAVYAGPAWQSTSIELIASQLGRGKGGGPLHETLCVFEC